MKAAETQRNEVRIEGPVGDMGYFFVRDLRNRVWSDSLGKFIEFGLGLRTKSFREAHIEAAKAAAFLEAA